jgi:autotransporter-associated beta strand protein
MGLMLALLAPEAFGQNLYWDLNGSAAGAGGPSPSATWDATSPFWNTNSDGTIATAPWLPGSTAIFSAGTDATGPYTITLIGTQALGGITIDSGTPTLTGAALELTPGSTIMALSGHNLSIASTITGPGAWTIASVATVSLSGPNTITGPLTITGGRVSFDSGSAAGAGNIVVSPSTDVFLENSVAATTLNSAITLNASRNVDISALAGSLALNGPIDGSRSYLTVGGQAANTVVLGAANSFFGNLELVSGTLVVTHDQALGATSGATLVDPGATLAFSNNIIYLGAEPVTVSGGGAGSLGAIRNLSGDNTFYGPVSLAGTVTIGADSGTLDLAATVSGASFNLNKSGPGRLTLSGFGNSYNATIINAGELYVSTTVGNGPVTVNPGTTLAGSGRTDGLISLYGTLSPAGVLTTGPQIWYGDSAFLWTIDDAGAGLEYYDWDSLLLRNGAATLNIAATAAHPVTLQITSLDPITGLPGLAGDFDNTAEYSFRFLHALGSVTGFNPALFLLDTSNFQNSLGNGAFAIQQTGNDLFLRFVQKPRITIPPLSQLIHQCQPVTFAVTAAGTAPLSYQWSFAGNSIPGATTTSYSIAAVAPANGGSYSVTVSNLSGYSTNVSATLTLDDPSPILTNCPADIAVSTGTRSTCDQIVSWAPPTPFDNCPGVSLSSDHNPGDTFPVGTTLVTYSATDSHGQTASCSFHVSVTDTTPPVVVTHPFSVALDSSDHASIAPAQIDNGSGDNCGIASFALDRTNFTCADVGPVTVHLTVTDIHGNSGSAPATVTVLDTNPPIALFTNVPVQLGADGSYTLTPADILALSGGSTDNCQIASRSVAPATLTFCDVGSKPVVLTVIDIGGNSGTASGNLTVLAPTGSPQDVYVDRTYPSTCAQVTFPNSGGVGTFFVTYNAFNSIQVALAAVAPAGRVHIAPGLYAEDLAITNPVSLLGPNAGLDGANPTRGLEAILTPATADPETGQVIYLAASHVVIDGFTFDSQNPVFTNSPAYGAGSRAVYSSAAIQNTSFWTNSFAQIDQVTIQNNVIRNFSYDGVYLELDLGRVNGFTYIQNNKFDTIWEGLQTYAVHSVIASNTMVSVNRGLSVHGVSVAASTGFTPLILSNSFTIAQWWPTNISRLRAQGIWVNYRRDSASPLLVSGNTINTPAAAPPGKTLRGLYALNVADAGTITLLNNTVNGAGNCMAGFVASSCWSNNAVQILGGSFNNILQNGVLADTADLDYEPGDAFVTLSNVSITMAGTGNGVAAVQDSSTPTNKGRANLFGGCSISGSAAAVLVQGTNAAASLRDNRAISGNLVGVDVIAGKALLENNVLTNNSLAAIRVQNDGVVDAGDCSGANTTGLGSGSGPNGSSAGFNDLSGYGFDSAAPWAVLNLGSVTVHAEENHFGASPADSIANVVSGPVAFAQANGAVTLAPPPITVQCIGDIPPGVTTLADFLALGGVAAASPATVSFSNNPPVLVTGNQLVTRTYLITDLCGHTAAANQTITVHDTTPPTITAPGAVGVFADPGVCFASNVSLGVPLATNDNCGILTATNNASAQFPVGQTTVTWTAVDINGLTASATQLVTVVDSQPPVPHCVDLTVTNEPGLCAAHVTFSLTASDNCPDPVNIVAVPASGSLFNVGTTPVQVTATDVHGNTNQCIFNVTVADAEPPTITCPADVTQINDPGQTYATVTFSLPSGSDNCGMSSVVATPPSGSQFPVGTNIVQVVATDIHSNQASCTFHVIVLGVPVITSQPLDRTNLAGTTATFSVALSSNSTPPFVFQWYKFGTNLLVNGGNISGATSSTFSLQNVIAADAGIYSVLVSNAAGALMSSNATLTVIDPAILTQPVGITNIIGSTVSFNVTAGGTPLLTYQWNLNGSPLSGRTLATLSLTNISNSDAGDYTVIVTSALGSVTSAVATLGVVPPLIVTQPTNLTVNLGQPAAFAVGVTGAGPFTFQWQKNSVNIPAATSSALSFANTVFADAAAYRVIVSDPIVSETSQSATLTLLLPQTQLILLAYTNDFATLTMSGADGFKYAIQGTPLLSPANWQTLVTSTAPYIFRDTNNANASLRFYRGLFVP